MMRFANAFNLKAEKKKKKKKAENRIYINTCFTYQKIYCL